MSAKNNINKDHYTQAGRDRPSDNILHGDEKEELTRAQKRVATGEAAAPTDDQPATQPEATLPTTQAEQEREARREAARAMQQKLADK